MKSFSPATNQKWMKNVDTARKADLPNVLLNLGFTLEYDSYRSWHIPGYGGLNVWKNEDGLWGWKRFSTDEHGDTISFLTEFNGMDRKTAVNTLVSYNAGTESCVNCSPQAINRAYKTSTKLIRSTSPPPNIWQQNALKVVKWAENNLWSDDNVECLDWLHARGLRDDTIRTARLGFVLQDCWPRREVWGLENRNNQDKLCIPKGLLIPIIVNGYVQRLEVRRFGQEDPKYRVIAGSWMGSFVIGEIGRPVIICESDLDAWLIKQEAGDIITAASLNGCGSKPDKDLAVHLLTAPRILVSLDFDPAGKKASKWWEEWFPNSKYWTVPWGKDPADAFGREPSLIRRWVECGLQLSICRNRKINQCN